MPVPYSERVKRTHCVRCGKELTTKQRNNRQQYCGRDCYYAKVGAKPIQEYTCQNCGETFKPTHNDRTTYCSRECAFEDISAWQAPQEALSRECPSCGSTHKGEYRSTYCSEYCRDAGTPKTCNWCGALFWGRYGEVYCSDVCRSNYTKATYAYRNRTRGWDTTCKECGDPIPRWDFAHYRWAYCSERCARVHSRRVGKAVRKARKRGNGDADSIDPFVVFKRARWRCELCGVSTPKRSRGTIKDNAPELDHIIPLANGGTHTWDNVQCLCRECNQAKGATTAGQMRLRLGV